jgi:hypothetical protein
MFGMSFKDDISKYVAAQIIKALGCPRGTAYDWLEGRREPPTWQQTHWLAILRRTVKPKEPPSTPKAGEKAAPSATPKSRPGR